MNKYEQLYEVDEDFRVYVQRVMKTYNKTKEEVLQLALVRFYGDDVQSRSNHYDVNAMLAVARPN